MPALALALLPLLLAAPAEAERVKLAYRFEAGSSYVDEQEREWWIESLSGTKSFRWKFSYPTKMKRTILEVDATDHPSIERVEVLRFARTVIESSTEAELEGKTQPASAEGKTFVWRRMKERWALLDAKSDVTDKHKQVVSHLQNWRDALLPKESVAVGDTWEVAAVTFLETAGQPVPAGVKGRSEFKLESLEKGIATIRFEFVCTYTEEAHTVNGRWSGTWRFDATRGRDVEFEAKAELDLNGGNAGAGGATIRRRFTWDPNSSGSTPRGS